MPTQSTDLKEVVGRSGSKIYFDWNYMMIAAVMRLLLSTKTNSNRNNIQIIIMMMIEIIMQTLMILSHPT